MNNENSTKSQRKNSKGEKLQKRENNIALELGSQIWYDSYMYTFATELF